MKLFPFTGNRKAASCVWYFCEITYSRPWDARSLGNGKTCVAQNVCNLSYLIRQRQDHQKNVQLFIFYFSLHKYMHLRFFWILFKNIHCQGPCWLRLCILRPYCNTNWNEYIFGGFSHLEPLCSSLTSSPTLASHNDVFLVKLRWYKIS